MSTQGRQFSTLSLIFPLLLNRVSFTGVWETETTRLNSNAGCGCYGDKGNESGGSLNNIYLKSLACLP